MGSEVSIIITLSVIIALSPYLSKLLIIPTTPIEIVLGSLGAYFGFLHLNHLFELIAEVGFFYLMFLAGTEVNIKSLLRLDRYIQKRGMIYIFLLYLLSFVISKLFGLSNIFITMLPLISVGLILTLYKEFDKSTYWLNLSMQIGVLGELISIVALTVSGALLKYGISVEFYETLAYLIIFLLIIVLVFKLFRILFWWYPELRNKLAPIDADKDEKDIRLSMALFFLMIGVMLILNLEVAFGAFIAGIFIATFFEHHKELPHKLSSFGFGFLVPIFFVHIGSTFNINSLMMDGLVLKALAITFAMIFIRLVSTIAFSGILSMKDKILFALSHSMPLTLLVAIATLAYHNDSIDQHHYYAFILASLFEVIIVMILIKVFAKLFAKTNSNVI
jgi:Kef-type K+ transport system membrane component KefB